MLAALGSNVAEQMREFSFEFSVDFDDRLTAARDPFTAIDDLTFTSSVISAPQHVIGDSKHPIVFKGLAHRLTGKNPLAFTVLGASPSTWSFLVEARNGEQADPASPFIGSRISLVSAIQTRSNSRVVFSGSVELFSDKFFEMQVNGQKYNCCLS